MQTREWKDVVDKSEWSRGRWNDEPDKKQWLDEVTGLPCLIVRGPMGSWCGYVGIEPSHPLYGKKYSYCLPNNEQTKKMLDRPFGNGGVIPFFLQALSENSDESISLDVLLDVHGGITFSDTCVNITFNRWKNLRAKRRVRKKMSRPHPIGDSARWLRDWGKELESFPAWREKMHARSICHITDGTADDKVWWFGFDCLHAGDYSPQMHATSRMLDRIMPRPEPLVDIYAGEQYRDVAYVTAETIKLATQLKALAA